MFMSQENKDSSELNKKDSWPLSKLFWQKNQQQSKRNQLDIMLLLLWKLKTFWPKKNGKKVRLKEKKEVNTDKKEEKIEVKEEETIEKEIQEEDKEEETTETETQEVEKEEEEEIDWCLSYKHNEYIILCV